MAEPAEVIIISNANDSDVYEQDNRRIDEKKR